MTRLVLYVAYPLVPSADEVAANSIGLERHDVATAAKRAFDANIGKATRWLAWLCESFPGTTFVAPWFAFRRSLRSGAWLNDTCEVAARCDGIVLCGDRISEEMRSVMEHGIAEGKGKVTGCSSCGCPYCGCEIEFKVYNLITAPDAPEPFGPVDFETWYASLPLGWHGSAE